MRKLLRADLARLFRDKLFYLAMAVSVGFELMVMSERYRLIHEYHYPAAMTGYLFMYFQLFGLVLSVFACLHLGRQYSDGTMRNKLVVGHRRYAVYFAGFLTTAAAAVILHAVSFLVGYVIGGLFLGGFTGSASLWLWPLLCGIFTAVSYAAVFTLIGMLCSQKAVTAVVSVLTAFLLLMGASYLSSALQQPEMIPEYELVVGEASSEAEAAEGIHYNYSKMRKNPSYLGEGFKRDCYQFLLDVLPGGQSYRIASQELDKPGLYMGYSVILTILVSGVGCIAFRRKDIQ